MAFPAGNYNRDGCTRGVGCKFSHAPDHKSVRDLNRLGCNVCVYFLLRDCRSDSWAYSHDKTYLPSGRWWDEERTRRYPVDIKGACPQTKSSLPAPPIREHRWPHCMGAPGREGRRGYILSENTEMLQHFGEEVDDDW